MAYARPLSPWAQRFGHGLSGRDAFLDDTVHHSGFAPEQPRLHPVHYADGPPPADSARTTLQLDHLFASEAFQIRYLRGCYSWMAGPLMRYVRFSNKTGLISGGHRAADYGPASASDAANAANLVSLINPPDSAGTVDSTDPVDPGDPMDITADVVTERQEDIALRLFHSERIQVDESKWYPFLKKDRWLDWDQPQPLLDGGNWSVDNPKVWEILSISIELLDRVLKALVADKHVMLETVMYGLNVAWEGAVLSPPPFRGATLLLSVPYVKRLCETTQKPCPLDFVTQFTPEDYATRLEHLLRQQTWTFIEKYNNSEGIWGITTGGLGELIMIEAGPIRRLLADDVTIAERCMLHFVLMVTMLHEMFHALFQSRKVDQTWSQDLQPINLVKRLEVKEPLLDDDAATEMGYAAEQRIFGGQFYIGTRLCDDLPFAAYIMSWPSPDGRWTNPEIIKNHATFRAGRKFHLTRVPALFTSKMLSAEFWDDATIAQKSANYFHSNRLFISDTVYPGDDRRIEYNTVGLNGDPGFTLAAGEQEMIAAWLERNQDWSERRAGWYEQARREWRATPWSEVQRRQLILKFGHGFIRKNRIECRHIADQLLGRVFWSEDKDKYIQDLPPSRQTNDWVFHAVGLLMLAALPIQNHQTRSPHTLEATYRFVPSKQTQEALKKKREVCRSRPEDDRPVPPSVLYDPLGRPGRAIDADHFVHEDYLDVLNRLVEHLAANDVAVPAPWLREIVNVAEDLRRQRRDVARSRRSWARYWKFRIPEYSHPVSRFENGRWTVQV